MILINTHRRRSPLRRSRRTAAVAVAVVVGLVDSGCGSGGPEIEVTDAVMLVPGAPDGTSVYLTIRNTGDEDDRLLNADTEVASMVMLHRTTIADDGRTSMSDDRYVDVPAGSTVDLAPGGLHLMLMDTEDRRPGDTFVLWLNFRRAGTVEVTVDVVTVDDLPT